jgi:dihydroflavonol-4-reductase
MQIFITGGTGFIGSHLVRRLAAAGYRLRCLARASSRREGLAAAGAEIVTGEITDRAALQAGMAGCEAVIHLAGLYAMWHPQRRDFVRVNLQGTRTLMETALAAGAPRVIHVSTAAVYGRPEERPFREGSLPGPRWFSDYGRSKAAADRAAWDCARRGLPLTVFYPGIVVGAGDCKASGAYLRALVRRATPSTIFQNSIVTYVGVVDVISAVERALLRPQSVGQKYLLGAEALTGQEFATLVSRVAGTPPPPLRLPDGLVTAAAYVFTGWANLVSRRLPPWGLCVDAARTLKTGFYFDGSKAEEELGLRYTPIRRALEDAIDWYRRG